MVMDGLTESIMETTCMERIIAHRIIGLVRISSVILGLLEVGVGMGMGIKETEMEMEMGTTVAVRRLCNDGENVSRKHEILL